MWQKDRLESNKGWCEWLNCYLVRFVGVQTLDMTDIGV